MARGDSRSGGRGRAGPRPKNLEDFFKQLAQGQPAPAVFLRGEEAYLRDAMRKRLVEAVVPEGARDWGVARYSAGDTDLAVILRQARTLPMLAPRQVIIVAGVEELESGGEEAREEAVRELAAYLDDPAPFTLLVLEAAGLDRRMKLARLLNEKTMVVPVELPEDSRERIPIAAAMAAEMAREFGAELAPQSAGALAEAVDGNLSMMRTELAKLATYSGPGGRITPEMIDALTPPARKYSVWQLAEMLAGRQRERALAFLDSLLREGEQPAGLVGAMAWMFRKLIETQELPRGASSFQVARQLGMRVETAEIAVTQAPRFSRESLKQAVVALAGSDSDLKSGIREPRAALEFVITRLSSANSGK
jgi:DNA polymerase-3 subunit delta